MLVRSDRAQFGRQHGDAQRLLVNNTSGVGNANSELNGPGNARGGCAADGPPIRLDPESFG